MGKGFKIVGFEHLHEITEAHKPNYSSELHFYKYTLTFFLPPPQKIGVSSFVLKTDKTTASFQNLSNLEMPQGHREHIFFPLPYRLFKKKDE